MRKILFIILDGVADNQETTPLMQATKPNLDSITSNGVAGLIENNLDKHPPSGLSTFCLLGYPKKEYPGRGYIEALGTGLEPYPGNVYLRANFANVEEEMGEITEGEFEPVLIVKDRRAGRETFGLKELSKELEKIMIEGIKFRFYHSLGHRGVLALTSIGISPNISDSDPMEINKRALKIKSLDGSNESEKTAHTLNKYLKEVYKVLRDNGINKQRKFPANYLLLRGAGQHKYVKTFKDRFGLTGTAIAATPVVRGVGKFLEMDTIASGTGDAKTDMKSKLLKALDELNKKEFVLLHIKATDIAAHDMNNNMRRIIIEKIDREIFARILEYIDEKTLLVVTSDHVTSGTTGEHLQGKFPFAIYHKNIERNNVSKFDEENCKYGPNIEISSFIEEVIKFI
jgi:2,3-bisphosphoglycerate-independent phosphoglycerate mutase